MAYHETSDAASIISGVFPLARGGTGQTSAQLALNSLAGAVTSGSYLRGNGTNVVMAALQTADVPTLNQNTTGTADNVSGVVGITHGGTGQITAQLAINALVGSTTNGYLLQGNGTNIVLATVPTWNQSTTGNATTATTAGDGLTSAAGTAPLTLTLSSKALTGSVAAMAGASAGANGAAGTVPAPLIAERTFFLRGDATWVNVSGGGGGTVTSVALTAPAEFTVTGSPVTAAGTLVFAKAVQTANYIYAGPTTGAAAAPAFRALVGADVPTLNQNTTGTAAGLSATLVLGSGGTGQASAQAAMNAFAGAVTSGSYLRGNGTNVVMSALQAADVPTLNQNTSGSAATAAVAGDGLSSATGTAPLTLTLGSKALTGSVATFTGATGIADGAVGVVPKPLIANQGHFLRGDGIWAAAVGTAGTVTSVDVAGGTTGLSTSGGPVTAAGTITLGGTLVVANGGTGVTSLTAGRIPYGAGTSALSTSANLTWDSGIPMLEVTGTVKGTILDKGGTVYNVKAYGAVGLYNGTTHTEDDTAAIQAAINAAYAAGGGNVFVPVGSYLIAGHLDVIPGVTLTGNGFDTHYRQTGVGSILQLTGHAGQASEAAAIVVYPHGALCNFTISYPNQVTTGTPTAYPYAIRTGGYAVISNIAFVDVYQGIDVGWTVADGNNSSCDEIHNIRGNALSVGIAVSKSFDYVHIKDVYFGRSGYDGLLAYQQANAIALLLGQNDWIVVEDFSLFGYAVGIKLVHVTVGQTSGLFTDIKLDQCVVGIWVEATQWPGVQFNNVMISETGTSATRHSVWGKPSGGSPDGTNTGYVNISNLSVFGNGFTPVFWENTGLLKLQNCIFTEWYNSSYAVYATAGTVMVNDCWFSPGSYGNPNGGVQSIYGIRIGASVERSVVTGNCMTQRALTIDSTGNPRLTANNLLT